MLPGALIGASLSEPHMNEMGVHENIYIGIWYVRHPRAAIIHSVCKCAIYCKHHIDKLLRKRATYNSSS